MVLQLVDLTLWLTIPRPEKRKAAWYEMRRRGSDLGEFIELWSYLVYLTICMAIRFYCVVYLLLINFVNNK
jgi:hypothetical protein